MKKVIPQKIVNIVYRKLLTGKRLEKGLGRSIGDSWSKNWRVQLFYRDSESNEISNKFFKNKVSRFIFMDKDEWWLSDKTISTKRRTDKWEDDLNDYIQKQ